MQARDAPAASVKAIMKNDNSLTLGSDVERSLRAVRSIDDLRRILSYPVWGFVTQLLNRTRAYDSALSGAELLVDVIKSYENELSRNEINSFLQSAYTLKLQMFDKLDFWNEYLEFWGELREGTDYEICYSRSSFQYLSLPNKSQEHVGTQSLQREDFVLRVERDSIYVHWLYLLSGRFEVIKRKLERKNKGRSTKSDLHHSQLDLSEQEIRRRLIEFERVLSSA